ncbi:hypothetical protein YC2023_058854 [Brassica napus]
MPNSTRSNKDKRLLFSEDPAHLERMICKDQRSTSFDAAAFTSTDSRTTRMETCMTRMVICVMQLVRN